MSSAPARDATNIITHTAGVFEPLQWLRLGIAGAVCIAINHACGFAFHLDLQEYDPASIMLSASPVRSVMMLLVALLCGCFAATAITRAQRRDAGVFCAFLSIAWISSHGAGLREALISYNSSKTYLILAGECCTIGGVAVAVLGVFDALSSEWRANDDLVDGFFGSNDTMPAKILAFMLTLAVYLGVLLIVAQTDRKPQVIASTIAAGLISTIISHFVLPVKPSAWYFAAPLVAGIIGNLMVYWIDPSGWEIGLSRSWASPLARPMPIDHFATGVAGSILGYWTARRMQVSADEDTQ